MSLFSDIIIGVWIAVIIFYFVWYIWEKHLERETDKLAENFHILWSDMMLEMNNREARKYLKKEKKKDD